MKKIILSVAAVFAFGFANAQDASSDNGGLVKGDVYVSGTFKISNEKTGNEKSNSFIITPGLGYMVSEKIAIEGSLGYISGTEETGGVETKNSGFGIGLGAKYFFTPADKFSLSIGGEISYASIKTEVGGFDGTTKQMGINVPVGLHYFVSNSIALTTTWGGFGYTSNDNGGNGADKTNAFELGLDLSAVSFGLIYKL